MTTRSAKTLQNIENYRKWVERTEASTLRVLREIAEANGTLDQYPTLRDAVLLDQFCQPAT